MILLLSKGEKVMKYHTSLAVQRRGNVMKNLIQHYVM